MNLPKKSLGGHLFCFFLPTLSHGRTMRRTTRNIICRFKPAWTLVLLFAPLQSNSGTIVGSAHDLSTGGTPEPCAFCHTPHYANTRVQGPLWNRFVDMNATFTLYASSTMNTFLPQPSPSSRLCLGCHDGVNATTMGNNYSGSTKHDLVKPPGHPPPDTTSWPNCNGCHADMVHGRAPKMLGTDLSDDHPISMTYPTPAQDPKFNVPPDSQNGWGPHNVRLVQGKVECVSCHDAHNPDYTPFLVRANAGSALCLTCHNK
jgi:predicted CXXCH cytochrome family protein